MDEPKEPHRRSIRLKEYDYDQPGAYFVTICTHRRECLFGDVVEGNIVLNKQGKIVEEQWRISVNIRREIELDELWLCQIMYMQ